MSKEEQNTIRHNVETVAEQCIDEKLKRIDDMAHNIKTNQDATQSQADEMSGSLEQLRGRIRNDINDLSEERVEMLQQQYENAVDEESRKRIVENSRQTNFDHEVSTLMDRRVSQMMDELNGGLLTYEQTTKVTTGFLLFVAVVIAYILYRISKRVTSYVLQ